MSQTISSQTSSFQTVIELVEALSIEEQDLLFSLVQKHRIVDRRQAICSDRSKRKLPLRLAPRKLELPKRRSPIFSGTKNEKDNLGRRF